MALQTCPKCGKQFYGTGCPDCDFPATPVDPALRKRTRFFGFVFIGVSVLVGCQFFTVSASFSRRLPLLVAALIFLLGGFQMVFVFPGRFGLLLGGLITTALAGLGFFAAFSHDPVSGGIPFLPAALNQAFGKFVFGFGAGLTALYALWFFYKMFKPDKSAKR